MAEMSTVRGIWLSLSQLNSMIKAIIFDMDGVLVDDFAPWMEFNKKFASHFGFVADNDYMRYVNGRSETETVEWVKEHFALAEREEEIMAFRVKEAAAIYEADAQPMAGAENLLKKVKKSGLVLALASGATRWQINTAIGRFDWRSYFQVIVSSDHVGYRGKPHPEIYLHTARLLNIDPANCVAVEDAENGVAAAKNAGMKCIGYKDLRFGLPDDLSRADLVVNSLADEKISKFLGI